MPAAATATVTITISGEDSDGDVLEGTPGDDALAGGIGSDTYYVENSTDTVTELVGEGDADRVIASTHFTLAAGQEIEFLETSDADGTAAINLRGNALQQTIEGNDGNNILHDGGTGPLPDDGVPDTLIGHGGDDTYIVYDPQAVIVEVAGEGNDRVAAGVNYVLQPDVSVEYLNTTSLRATYAVNLTGNNLVQWMRGNDGANVLDGGGGSDNIFGMGGADTFRFSTDLAPDNIDQDPRLQRGGRHYPTRLRYFHGTGARPACRVSVQGCLPCGKGRRRPHHLQFEYRRPVLRSRRRRRRRGGEVCQA